MVTRKNHLGTQCTTERKERCWGLMEKCQQAWSTEMQEMQSQAKTMVTVKEALEGHNDTMIGGLVQLSSYCCLK